MFGQGPFWGRWWLLVAKKTCGFLFSFLLLSSGLMVFSGFFLVFYFSTGMNFLIF
jgi:hypothetical protein